MKKILCLTISLLLFLGSFTFASAANVNTLGSYYGPNPIYIGDFGLGMIMGEDPAIFNNIPDHTVSEYINNPDILYDEGYAFHLGAGFYFTFGYSSSYKWFMPFIIDSTTGSRYPFNLSASEDYRITNFDSLSPDSVVSFDDGFALYDYIDRHDIVDVDFTRDLYFSVPAIRIDGTKKAPDLELPSKIRIGARPGTVVCSNEIASTSFYNSHTYYDQHSSINLRSDRFISQRCTYTDLTYITNIPNAGIPYFNSGFVSKTVTIPNSALRAMTSTNYNGYADFADQYGYEIIEDSLYLIPNIYKSNNYYFIRLCFYNVTSNTLYKGDRHKYVSTSKFTLDETYPSDGSITITYEPIVDDRYIFICCSPLTHLGDYSSGAEILTNLNLYACLIPPIERGLTTYFNSSNFYCFDNPYKGPTNSDITNYVACYVCDFLGTYDTSIFTPYTEGVSAELPNFDYDRFDPYSPDPLNPTNPPGPIDPSGPTDPITPGDIEGEDTSALFDNHTGSFVSMLWATMKQLFGIKWPGTKLPIIAIYFSVLATCLVIAIAHNFVNFSLNMNPSHSMRGMTEKYRSGSANNPKVSKERRGDEK